MIELKKYYQEGLLFEIFHAKTNLLIWELIASEYDFLSKQKKHIKDLYSFIQQSAGTNFILHIAKLYDKKKKHPTMCISDFIELIKNQANTLPKISQTGMTTSLLVAKKASQRLITSVTSENANDFPNEFYIYYKSRYEEELIQKAIQKLNTIRSKSIAHNEIMLTEPSIDFSELNMLLNFAMDIAFTYATAYENEYCGTGGDYPIELSVLNAASFISENIELLRKNH